MVHVQLFFAFILAVVVVYVHHILTCCNVVLAVLLPCILCLTLTLNRSIVINSVKLHPVQQQPS